MGKILRKETRKKLIRDHREERDSRVRDRIKAILAYDDGYTEIAKILLLDDETIRRHIKEYKNDKKLTPVNGGSDSHLEEKTYLYVKESCGFF